jgi:cobalt/nickel transport system permease protein
MHMADALLSPSVGGAMWAAAAGSVAYCSRKVREDLDERKVPLMGVLGAFVFAAQMINFTIPGTGSSGHLGGGLLLAILLGPHAGFLALASVLTVQALFFADGGLLALGSNIINLGVFPCFVAYPLVYRPLSGGEASAGRIGVAAVTAAVVALQLGALGVVLETVISGVSELPLRSFLLLMQPIHLAIGLVEGFATAAVIGFVWRTRPEILQAAGNGRTLPRAALRRLIVVVGIAAVVTGGGLSWLASEHPDGLEWSIERLTGVGELGRREETVHQALEELQRRTSVLPDYGFRAGARNEDEGEEGRLPLDSGTSVSGIVGAAATLTVIGALGALLRRRSRQP